MTPMKYTCQNLQTVLGSPLTKVMPVVGSVTAPASTVDLTQKTDPKK